MTRDGVTRRVGLAGGTARRSRGERLSVRRDRTRARRRSLAESYVRDGEGTR